MSASTPSGSPGTLRLIATASTLLGPFGAWLYEAGSIDLFGSTSLANLWVVVAMALAGVGIGVYAIARGCKLSGAVCLLINMAVTALYGFLAVFFGLGGSR